MKKTFLEWVKEYTEQPKVEAATIVMNTSWFVKGDIITTPKSNFLGLIVTDTFGGGTIVVEPYEKDKFMDEHLLEGEYYHKVGHEVYEGYVIPYLTTEESPIRKIKLEKII